ncbi:CMGC family protein kinase [Histomonas meleagridis]|uniref:CMGC family protein kinase n=1 Tax=Histomonas meleagridis TaxID=135588 RepID=UPI0035598FF3|nr:CMGC family protein kinase [Histomonas meleagridis]KAH0796859.1 CMGC family protein kinase [Histomonas meleagridis]
MIQNRSSTNEQEQEETINYKLGNIDDYELIGRIGRGKYSTVFSGIRKDGILCVLKVLRPVKIAKINREIKVLIALRKCPFVTKLYDVVQDPESLFITLVMEYVFTTDFKQFIIQLTTHDLSLYMYQILKALDHAHSHGIMHRDIKPGNIMIDANSKKLRVIDWGLAAYYSPQTAYPVRVATRNYKAPELLLNYNYYDFSVDIWGLGCTFATFLFRKMPFFRGRDPDELLLNIAQVCGSDELFQFANDYKLRIPQHLVPKLTAQKKKNWDHWKTDDNAHLFVPEALDLLSKMLVIDPKKRITAKEALEHPYFNYAFEK